MPSRRESGGLLTPSAKAAVISYAAVILALLFFFWGMLQAWDLWFAICALVAIGCAVVISGLRMPVIGVILIGLFCFTASWDDVGIGPVNARQLFLLFGGLLLAPTLDVRRLPPVPWWLHAYGFAAVLATALQVMMPISGSYLDERYATSESGQALGERPGTLASLASLLFNNYAVPVVIVLACMCAPKAFRWLLGAYVAGAALCCLAAILGYYGFPILMDVFGGVPYPAGARAAGFTSHPLRLATAGFMAIAIACWMVLQPQRLFVWVGWASLPLLLGGLYVSGSRGGIGAGLLLLILCMFMLPAARERIHEVIGVVGVAIMAVLFAFPSIVESVLGQTRLLGNDTTAVSDAGRGEVLAQAFDDFHESPVFGIGVRYLAEAHTLYLGVLAAGGLIFGIGFLLFNVGSLITAARTVAFDRALGGALLATLIATLGYWLVADLIQTKTVAILFGFVIALWWYGQDADAADQAGVGDSLGSPRAVGSSGSAVSAEASADR